MRVQERIISIILAEKIKADPKHAKKIGVELINQKSKENKEK